MNDLPDRFPRGWFVLGHQRDFPAGKQKQFLDLITRYLLKDIQIIKLSVDVDGDKSWPVIEQNQMVMIWHDVKSRNLILFQIELKSVIQMNGLTMAWPVF